MKASILALTAAAAISAAAAPYSFSTAQARLPLPSRGVAERECGAPQLEVEYESGALADLSL